MPVKSAKDSSAAKGAAAKASDKSADKAADKGAAAKSPPAKAEAKESVLNEVAKATGVSKDQIAKVLDHLGLGQKLSGLDAKLAKDALNKVSAANLKLAIKLDDGSIVV